MKRTSRLVILVFLGWCFGGGAWAWAGNAFLAGDAVERFSEEPSSPDLEALVGPANISQLWIEDDTGAAVTSINRGKAYIFWIEHQPLICSPYANVIGFFRSGKLVQKQSWENPEPSTECNISATGIYVTVPTNAPLGNYTWGARNTNPAGTSQFYPAAFSIVQ